MLKPLQWWLPAVLVGVVALPAPASAAGSGTADELESGLGGLVAQLSSPSVTGAAARARAHATKREVIVGAFSDQVGGVSAATVIEDFDCISLNLQRARNTDKKRLVRARLADARTCRSDLASAAAAGKAAGLAGDLLAVDGKLKAIAARATAGRAYGAKATTLRKLQSSIVARRFSGQTLHGVAFADVYDDLECVDVKLEAGRAGGAASCAKRLLRRAKALAPAKEPLTFGSDLSGTPVALPARFAPDDTEFWTPALTVPTDGTITSFRLKTGDSPVELPLRFSVVRPSAGGTVTVVTTTNPVYTLSAHDAGTHSYSTSALSFACCTVRKGDIVTVDNSGTTTSHAYVWFAARADITTSSHTSGGDSQNAGAVWTPITHPGYETLLQVVMQPD
ncbi:MAG: hypothetical protein JWR63_335 [Conexibacter sp.]|nr:hypothetical protein [Conexibacter sp.]